MRFLIDVNYKCFVMPSGVSRLQSRGKSYKQDWERNLSRGDPAEENNDHELPCPGTTYNDFQAGKRWTDGILVFRALPLSAH